MQADALEIRPLTSQTGWIVRPRRTIDPAFCKRRQSGVLVLFLIEAQLEEVDDLQATQLLLVNHAASTDVVRPGDERAIAGDFVALDGLCRREHRGIADIFVLNLADEVLALLNQAEDRLTGHPLWSLTQSAKDLFQAFDLFLCLLEMVLEVVEQCRIDPLAHHLL